MVAFASIRKIGEMKEVAYKPEDISLGDDDAAYFVIRQAGRNLTIFAPYRLGGGEFPKTYGHFHVPPHEETYKVLFGKAAFLLQKMDEGKVSEVIFKTLEVGETFTVPKGYGHVMLNMGDDYVITMDDHDPAHFDNNYEMVKKMRGFGYYIVEKGKGWEAVPNPAYSNLSPLKENA